MDSKWKPISGCSMRALRSECPEALKLWDVVVINDGCTFRVSRVCCFSLRGLGVSFFRKVRQN